MKSTVTIYLILFILLGCNSSNRENNLKLINNINTLEISKKVIELNTDENKQVIDTSSITFQKVNSNEEIVYEKKVSFTEKGKSTVESYFTNEKDLFYRKTVALKGTYETIYETIRKGEEIDKAILINIEFSKPVDTIVMNYSYVYDSETKKELNILVDHKGFKTKKSMNFTSFGKIENENSIINQDTISSNRFSYKNQKLHKLEIINNLSGYKLIYRYSKDEKIIKEEEYSDYKDTWQKQKQTEYFYDKEGNKTEAKITDISNKQISFRIYVIE
jgi:hypothetical protein